MMRCGGAGLGGFLTPTGVGTVAEEGKQLIELDGRKYILVPALKCDIAIVRAHAGDTWGNLIYRGTSRNFNVPAAMCADYVIAEVENLYVARRARPERDPHVRHLRRRRRARQRRVLHAAGGEAQWPDAKTDHRRPRRPASSRTARSSTWASACRPSSPTTCPRASTSSSRPRTAPSAWARGPDPGCEDRDRANAGNQPITLIPGRQLLRLVHLVLR